MNFDREFWIKILQENGFKIEPTEYSVPDEIKESLKGNLIVENIEVLYNNFPAQIIFVYAMVPLKGRLTRELAGWLVWLMRNLHIISALPVFIISDGGGYDSSYVFTYIIDRGEPVKYVARHFSGELTPAQRKILKNLKPYENAKDPVEAYNNLLSGK